MKYLPWLLCSIALVSCADSLAGPGPDDCIFAYSIKPPGPIDIALGDSASVTAVRNAGCGASWPVTWTVANGSIASVRATGDSTAVVRGTAVGSTAVTVSNNDRSGFLIVRVD